VSELKEGTNERVMSATYRPNNMFRAKPRNLHVHEVVKEALIRIRQAEKVTRAESTAYEKWETTLAVKIGEWLIKNWCDDAALFALDCEVEYRVLRINDGLRVQNPNSEISYFHGTVKVLARLGEC
ncbi:hypothetical protein JCM3766R1_007180, partial [Sporobolomyces carnicolor]